MASTVLSVDGYRVSFLVASREWLSTELTVTVTVTQRGAGRHIMSATRVGDLGPSSSCTTLITSVILRRACHRTAVCRRNSDQKWLRCEDPAAISGSTVWLGNKCMMKFYPDKSITRMKQPITYPCQWSMDNIWNTVILPYLYLGVNVSKDMRWTKHIG